MKKLLIFLMIAIPIIIIVIMNATISVVTDIVSIPVEKVELNSKTYVSNIDEEYQLTANIYPTNASDKTVFYESSNEDVLVVDKFGKVTFMDFGNAYVTVTTLDGNKKSSCYFVVTDTKVHGVLLYTVDDINEIEIGKSLQVYAEIFPKEASNQNVIYTSSNQSVATINENGLITGLNAGETEITVTTVDGEFIDSKKFTVYREITNFELKENNVVLEKPIYQIPLTILPVDAKINRINFSSSDESIATVSTSGLVNFLKEGKVEINISYKGIEKICLVEYTNGYIQDIKASSIITCNYEDVTLKLNYETFPKNLYNTELTFYSSNKDVATVDNNGLVELKKGGNTTIIIEAKKYDGTLLSKNITLFVERDCEEIIAEDILTASSTVKVDFQSMPEDNTSDDFEYIVDGTIASVDSYGNLEFTSAGYVYLTIKAKKVEKTIKVTYTGGYAENFDIINEYEIFVNNSIVLTPSFVPSDTIYKNVKYEISSESPIISGSDVISITENKITAISGGSAIILAKLQCKDLSTITKIIEISVKQNVSSIVFETDLETYQNDFVTSVQNVEIKTNVLPLDATEIDIEYSVNNTDACVIFGNKLFFNYPARVVLTAKNLINNVTNSINICYTNTILNIELNSVKNQLEIGESVSVMVNSCIPSSFNNNLLLKLTSQQSNSNNDVVQIIDNSIKAIGGGKAQISVYVAGTFIETIDITVSRIAESLDIFPKNIKTTSNQITLYATVLPLDVSIKKVEYTIQDTNIAVLDNNVLTFLNNGIVHLTARTIDGSNLTVEFTIEKISLSQDISTDITEHRIYVGQFVTLKSSDNINVEFSIISGEENITATQSGLIYARQAGTCIVNTVLKDENNFVIESKTLKITIFDLVKDFELNNFEYFNYEYITAEQENDISFNVYPEGAQKQINYYLNNTTIAKIENNKLIFYGTGVVELRANSIDGNCIKVFTIRYTGGGAYAFTSNLSENITLNKGDSIHAEITNWYPNNTINKSFSLKVLGDTSQKIVDVENTKITALTGGEIQIILRVSTNLSQIINIKVLEEVAYISFKNIQSLTYETNVYLDLSVYPETATNKNVIFTVDNLENAYIENSVLIFKKPSKVIVKAYAEENENIFDQIEIESTMGYVKDFEIMSYDVTLKAGEVFEPEIISFTPNVINQIYKLEIVESTSNVADKNVITIVDNKVIAQNGGIAKVKIYPDTPYAEKPYKIFILKVIKDLEHIDIQFNRELDNKDNTFVTAINSVNYDIIPYPLDASVSDVEIIFDEEYVFINDNKIQFIKTGISNITFKVGLVSKEISLMWTNNECIEAKVYDQDFEQNGTKKVLKVKPNDIYEFKIDYTLPSDLSSINIKLLEKNVKQNYSTLSVYSFENKLIKFLNGGEVTFEVLVNNISAGEYTFVVEREANEISAELVQYTAISYYLIMAEVKPNDTTNKTLEYSSFDENIAVVNSNGEVTFLLEGKVNIEITSSNNLTKIIEIVYSRKIDQIIINETKTTLSVGGTLLLTVQWFPNDIENVKLKFISSNTEIATVDDKGRVVANDTVGYVTITVCLEEDESIFDTIILSVSKYITNIALKDDIIEDNLGIKGERVFGTLYLNSDNTFSNTYQMEILSITPNDLSLDLIWTSSDEKIATVDNKGLVTFLSFGSVTIRVEPKEQYSIIKPIYDSYTFKLVDAVNITNYDEYIYCSNNNLAVVLQNDIILTDDIIEKYTLTELKISSNIYGNGHLLTAYNLNSSYNKFVVSSDNILIDNVVIRGEDLTKKTLEDLTDKATLIILWFRKNITINNSILENGLNCLRVYSSTVNLNGTIIQNGGVSNLLLSHENNSQIQTVVTAKNCIFKDALFGSIVYDLDTSDNDTYASKFIAKGNLYIYNFRQAKELACPIVSDYVPNITASLQDLFSQFTNIKHIYNGKEYYHLGIVILNADYVVGKYFTQYKLDLSGVENRSNYNLTNVSGKVFIYDVYPITFNIELLTIMPNNTTITPASNYDSTIYKEIREL